MDQVYWGNPHDVDDAQFALRWSDSANKIYLAMQVDDRDHVFRDDYGSWHASDRAEVYCQATGEGGAGWQGVYDIAQQYYIASDTVGGAWCSWALGRAVDPNVGLEYAVSVEGDTILYEIGITPFETYGGFVGGDSVQKDLEPEDVIRFDFTALTRSTSDVGMLSENLNIGKSNNADQFSRYLLSLSGMNQCSTVVGDFNGDCEINILDLRIFGENWFYGL